ncbi:hypothetical protein [Thiocapsa sp. N5-Cardenillas]|uniref:hypothetical protein n=1 Tax=Thiocapsa sp. N5-Cardenillas TaxID=3137397 RepID=UPI0035B0A7DD
MNKRELKKIEAMRDKAIEKHVEQLKVKPDSPTARQFWSGQVLAFNKVLDACKKNREGLTVAGEAYEVFKYRKQTGRGCSRPN